MLFDETTPQYASATRRPVRVAVPLTSADITTALDEVAALERSLGRPLEVGVGDARWLTDLSPDRVERILTAAAAELTWALAGTGTALGSWLEAAAAAPSALPDAVLERARSIADLIGPGRRIRRSRILA